MDKSIKNAKLLCYRVVYRGGVGYFSDLVAIFSTLLSILAAVMSYPNFTPKTLSTALTLSHPSPKPNFFCVSRPRNRGP